MYGEQSCYCCQSIILDNNNNTNNWTEHCMGWIRFILAQKKEVSADNRGSHLATLALVLEHPAYLPVSTQELFGYWILYCSLPYLGPRTKILPGFPHFSKWLQYLQALSLALSLAVQRRKKQGNNLLNWKKDRIKLPPSLFLLVLFFNETDIDVFLTASKQIHGF